MPHSAPRAWSRPTCASLAVAIAALALSACGSRDVPLLPSPGAVPELRVVPSTHRLRADQPPPAGSDTIELHAARGEVESVQVVLDPVGAADVAVTVHDLVHSNGSRRPDDDPPIHPSPALAADAVTVFEQRALTVSRPSPGGSRGRFYDPLVPLEAQADDGGGSATSIAEARGGEPVALWLDVAVPRDAAPGTYEGRIMVRLVDQREAVAIPMQLHVSRLQLPRRPLLGSSVGVDESQVLRFEGTQRGTPAHRAMLASYLDIIARHRLAPADLYVDDSIGEDPAAFARSDDGRRLRELVDGDAPLASLRVPIYQTHPYADPLGADRERAIAYLRGVASYYRRMGWLDRAYVYFYDEPRADQQQLVHAAYRLVKEADPDLQVLLTTAPGGAFDGAADIWSPNLGGDEITPALVQQQQRAGHGFWWYPSISTHPPHPTLFIDDARPGPRLLGWLAFTHGIEGILYWSATHFHEVGDPWSDAGTYNDSGGAVGNGDGTLVYPGRPVGVTGPVPSVRLKQLRDGMEEYDLLVMASREGAGPSPIRELAAAAVSASDGAGIIETAAALRGMGGAATAPLELRPAREPSGE